MAESVPRADDQRRPSAPGVTGRDRSDRRGVNLLGAVTWAFLFEDQPYFDGFRDLATNGIGKPVLNTFRMPWQMRGHRVKAVSSAGLAVEAIRDAGVRGAPDISALAARSDRSATVLVWNYHDDDLPAPAAPVTLTIEGLPAGSATITHHRIEVGMRRTRCETQVLTERSRQCRVPPCRGKRTSTWTSC